ncbi:lipopolysaccharide biosynthesis protein [Thioclava sp. F36-7]|uniref:lipopolysaccharide biosynthesis protein n=1 Tax=Thioclava sp. F36-7 TaxID=1915317 RepID=UPI0009976848|nr:lipopolysaccharide biosynthesis protein [Thioclava sp. F36-7]OOY10018.1 hypothetical protein BMI89_04225 [Thioclava sp. F36-7]
MTDTRTRLLKGAVWIALGSMIANGIGFLNTIIMARLLVPEDFGLVAICAAVMAILLSLAEMPLSETLVRHDAPTEEHFNTVFSMSFARGLIVGGAVAALSYPVALLYGDMRLQNILLVMAGSFVFAGLANPKLALFERELVFHQVVLMKVGEKLFGTIVAITLALVFRSYWALVLGAVASDVARIVLSYVFYPFRPRLTFSKYREILSFSIWITLGTWIQAMNWRANPLLFGAVLPTNILGQYSFGNRITNVVIAQLNQPLQRTFFPAFSRVKNDRQKLVSAYKRVQGVACLWIFPFGFGLAVVAHDLVALVLGEKWMPAVPVIQIQAIILALQATVAIQPIAMATGDTRHLFFRDLRAFFIRWPLILLGMYLGSASYYGMLIGALIGGAVAVVINIIWNMTLVTQIAGIRLREQLKLALTPTIAVAFMALVVWLTGSLWEKPPSVPLEAVRLVSLITIGGMAYVAAVAALWQFNGRKAGPELEMAQLLKALFTKASKFRRTS